MRDVPLDQIRPNPKQPRRRFDQESLLALADSILERGLQPVIVRPRESDSYKLIAGERRWRATRIAGLADDPALIDDAADDAASLEPALIENTGCARAPTRLLRHGVPGWLAQPVAQRGDRGLGRRPPFLCRRPLGPDGSKRASRLARRNQRVIGPFVSKDYGSRGPAPFMNAAHQCAAALERMREAGATLVDRVETIVLIEVVEAGAVSRLPTTRVPSASPKW